MIYDIPVQQPPFLVAISSRCYISEGCDPCKNPDAGGDPCIPKPPEPPAPEPPKPPKPVPPTKPPIFIFKPNNSNHQHQTQKQAIRNVIHVDNGSGRASALGGPITHAQVGVQGITYNQPYLAVGGSYSKDAYSGDEWSVNAQVVIPLGGGPGKSARAIAKLQAMQSKLQLCEGLSFATQEMFDSLFAEEKEMEQYRPCLAKKVDLAPVATQAVEQVQSGAASELQALRQQIEEANRANQELIRRLSTPTPQPQVQVPVPGLW